MNGPNLNVVHDMVLGKHPSQCIYCAIRVLLGRQRCTNAVELCISDAIRVLFGRKCVHSRRYTLL